ncbi:MAG: glycosyltransferase family 4 protein [Akkermansia sp.]|nr:glycosyltransferase family 4 protein [Akkermansia sp.]
MARELAHRGHNITVISTGKFYTENKEAIIKESIPIRLVTKDFPESRWIRSYKIWQAHIASIIQQEVQNQKYDVIHHITFNQYRGIKDVFYTDIPALIGPIGGAEVIPVSLFRYGSLPFWLKIKEFIRYIPWDSIPLIQRINKRSQPLSVLCSNQITANRLTKGLFRVKGEVRIVPAIAINESEIYEDLTPPTPNPYILFDGGLSRPQKGTWLMLGAIKHLWKQGLHIPIRIVGLTDKEKSIIHKKAADVGIPQEALQLYNFIPRPVMLKFMREAIIFLSTVFRDSGAMAQLEALAQGTRIVSLDIPSQLWLPTDMASKVKVQSSRNAMEKEIARLLKKQIDSPSHSEEWNIRRIKFLKKYMTWESRVDLFESIYKKLTQARAY